MLKNYIKIARRNLWKSKDYGLLNIFGLSIGMVRALLISLYIYDELTYDTMFTNAERIYRIDMDFKFGGAESKSAEASAPMANSIKILRTE